MMLRLDQVTIRRGDRRVLGDVSATLAGGEFIALVGPNGAGKTSLLLAMAGLLSHSGDIALEGAAIASMSASRRARTIGYLPQGHLIHWPLPVREIVALGRFAHGATDPRRLPEADRAAVDDAMAETGIALLANRRADTLSGGERARVALARVLAVQSAVILADEPTAALDPSRQLGVMETLGARARAGALVVAVTHDLDLAANHATRILLLHEGRLVADGPPADALSPERMRAVFGIRRTPGRMERA